MLSISLVWVRLLSTLADNRHITNIRESRPNGSRPNGGLICAAIAKNKFCFHLCIPIAYKA